MIVKDLLDSCNIENVTSTIMEIASVDESDRLSVKKAHSLYIQRIRSIEPVNTLYLVSHSLMMEKKHLMLCYFPKMK